MLPASGLHGYLVRVSPGLSYRVDDAGPFHLADPGEILALVVSRYASRHGSFTLFPRPRVKGGTDSGSLTRRGDRRRMHENKTFIFQYNTTIGPNIREFPRIRLYHPPRLFAHADYGFSSPKRSPGRSSEMEGWW